MRFVGRREHMRGDEIVVLARRHTQTHTNERKECLWEGENTGVRKYKFTGRHNEEEKMKLVRNEMRIQSKEKMKVSWKRRMLRQTRKHRGSKRCVCEGRSD